MDSLDLSGDPGAARSREVVDVSSTLHAALDLMVGRGLRSVTVARDGQPVGVVGIEDILSRVQTSDDNDPVGA